MWWNDISDIKELICLIELRLESFEEDKLTSISMDEIVRYALDEIFNSEDENSSVNRIHDKLNILVHDERREQAVELAQISLDKFEDYMKNVDKLNGMMNEFKGCVSLARAAISERKGMTTELKEIQRVNKTVNDIYGYVVNFIDYYKRKEMKKSKPRTEVKKKKATRAPSPE